MILHLTMALEAQGWFQAGAGPWRPPRPGSVRPLPRRVSTGR